MPTLLLLLTLFLTSIPSGVGNPEKILRVRPTADFTVAGDGRAVAWQKAETQSLTRRGGTLPYEVRVKMLYSSTGLYLLMEGSDQRVTATFMEDFQDLWKEDAFEAYFWPEEKDSLYLEYQISPLGKELILLIPNLDGKFLGWRPWHYEGGRKTRKAVSGVGGTLQSGAAIAGWKAEIFLPYELFTPLRNVPPRPGTRWRANFYRMDHDQGARSSWHWAPVGPSFHEPHKFGVLIFE